MVSTPLSISSWILDLFLSWDSLENLMPKVDGVTRCLARLLEHLRKDGHECVVLGPESEMKEYETHPLYVI